MGHFDILENHSIPEYEYSTEMKIENLLSLRKKFDVTRNKRRNPGIRR